MVAAGNGNLYIVGQAHLPHHYSIFLWNKETRVILPYLAISICY